MNILRIAWRNLWRNKRRTLITAASVFFAIWFALIMRAFQLGSYELMVNNIVHAFSGYFQVHAKGYWGDQTLNNAFESEQALMDKLRKCPEISGFTGRLESFALASSGNRTKGALVTGIEPRSENSLTSLRRKVISGNYLREGENGALVSRQLASYLKIGIGDSVVIIGQGYQGVSAAGVFPVRGIVAFPSPELDGRMIYLSLTAARELFSAPAMLTSLAFNVADPSESPGAAATVKELTDPAVYEVMTWEEMMPDVVQQIKADSASGLIMLGILYMIVGFGVFGTMLMMLNERRREFGMMIAIGMQKSRLILIVVTEMLLLGSIGLSAGILAAIPPIWYYHAFPIRLTGEMADSVISMGFEPLMPTAWEYSFFAAQSLVVLTILILLMLLPVMRIRRLNVMQSLRH